GPSASYSCPFDRDPSTLPPSPTRRSPDLHSLLLPRPSQSRRTQGRSERRSHSLAATTRAAHPTLTASAPPPTVAQEPPYRSPRRPAEHTPELQRRVCRV